MTMRWLMAGAAPLALCGWLATSGEALAQADYSEGRPRDAVNMCLERAQELAEDNDVDDLEIDEVSEAEENDDRVQVEMRVEGRDNDNDRVRADVECEVGFSGNNAITAFNEEDFVEALQEGGGGGNRSGNNSSNNRSSNNSGGGRNSGDGEAFGENAREACRRAAQQEDFNVRDLRNRERDGDRVNVDMQLTRNDNRWTATCVYSRDGNQASLRDIQRAGN